MWKIFFHITISTRRMDPKMTDMAPDELQDLLKRQGSNLKRIRTIYRNQAKQSRLITKSDITPAQRRYYNSLAATLEGKAEALDKVIQNHQELQDMYEKEVENNAS